MTDMVDGYLDGLDPASPEPSANRSRSCRHGFANGRDDLAGNPRASAADLRIMADDAEFEAAVVSGVMGRAKP